MHEYQCMTRMGYIRGVVPEILDIFATTSLHGKNAFSFVLPRVCSCATQPYVGELS